MNILLILSESQDLQYYLNTLTSISEQETVIVLNSFTEANNFVAKELIDNQLEIDLIIAQNNIAFDHITGAEFMQEIRFNLENTYSRYDFNLRTIPIILLFSKDANSNEVRRTTDFHYTDIITKSEYFELYIEDIVRTVKNWRRSLLNELDNLGIDYKSGQLNYSRVDINRMLIPTQILSENFKTIHRRLDYIWLNTNVSQIEESIDQFLKEVKWSERGKSKDEKKFHRFFNDNPLFIQRDIYKRKWYEPRLRYKTSDTTQRFIEPDYSLQPSFKSETNLSVLEVKLPTEGFVRKTKFHPKPYSSFLDHLFQVSDYKEYLENQENKNEIEKVLGFNPNIFDYHLLIGRKEQKEEQYEVLSKRMNQMNMNYINLITYDDLSDYQVKFLQRMKMLEIK